MYSITSTKQNINMYFIADILIHISIKHAYNYIHLHINPDIY